MNDVPPVPHRGVHNCWDYFNCPTLLFERYFQGQKSDKRFFACSACRDRKDCDFFQHEDEKISDARKQARHEFNRSKQPEYTHNEYYKRYQSALREKPSKRSYCHHCNLLLSPKETKSHGNHRMTTNISNEQLLKPSFVMAPLENKKTNAQYLYNEKTVEFLLKTIQTLGFDRVVCIGTPRLHEVIMSSEQKKLDSLLLDIDHRYYQFYPPNNYCRYNMFNHHFFDGDESEKYFQDFLHRNGGDGVVVVTDPPFGGLVEVLAFTIKRIMMLWHKDKTDVCRFQDLPVIWTFPYFLEFRIVKWLPSFHMSDYKVGYDNHALFQCGKKNKGTPVRLFTNLSPKTFVLPKEDGYRFCDVCDRYISSENVHCEKCNKCTSKDGRRYHHCELCNHCVKPGREHCSTCNRCELVKHRCISDRSSLGCHICGDLTHKRRECPQRTAAKPGGKGNRKRKHNSLASDTAGSSDTTVIDESFKTSADNVNCRKDSIESTGVYTTDNTPCKHRRKPSKSNKKKRKFHKKS
uniref:Zinc finger CCHC domain-containing protein 4-like n=1 Tax=Saccoglossus kowalevskii TaxID=10224 RepID=A0ABM0GVS1_SACKO|nr:PREDICTED: zinc finger CCHC domain-containing protein 4-like [Saccoglossus kowalevskii]